MKIGSAKALTPQQEQMLEDEDLFLYREVNMGTNSTRRLVRRIDYFAAMIPMFPIAFLCFGMAFLFTIIARFMSAAADSGITILLDLKEWSNEQ